jgi:hypothetical protein
MNMPGFTAEASLDWSRNHSFVVQFLKLLEGERARVIPQGIFCHVLSADEMWGITGIYHWGVYCHRH